MHEGRGHRAGKRVAELEQHDEGQHREGRIARQEIAKAPLAVGTTRANGSPCAVARPPARCSGSVATSAVTMPTSTSAAIATIAPHPRRLARRSRAPSKPLTRNSRPRSRPACRCGRRRRSPPCRRPARSPTGFRPGTRRRRCPAWRTRSRPAARPAPTTSGGAPDRAAPATGSPPSAAVARRRASRAGGRAGARATGHRSASTSGAHRNLIV